MSNKGFNEWLKSHPCGRETLWYIQNMLGSVLGFDHPLTEEATKAWADSRVVAHVQAHGIDIVEELVAPDIESIIFPPGVPATKENIDKARKILLT